MLKEPRPRSNSLTIRAGARPRRRRALLSFPLPGLRLLADAGTAGDSVFEKSLTLCRQPTSVTPPRTIPSSLQSEFPPVYHNLGGLARFVKPRFTLLSFVVEAPSHGPLRGRENAPLFQASLRRYVRSGERWFFCRRRRDLQISAGLPTKRPRQSRWNSMRGNPTPDLV